MACAQLGLRGYVMNLKDGRVRVRVEGSREAIEELEAALGELRDARATIEHLRAALPGGSRSLVDLRLAFYALGAFAFLFSFALPAVHRWSLAGGKPD